MLVELGTRLNLVQWDDDVLEKDHMLISQGHRESTDDTGQNIEELGGSIEFMVFVDQSKETLVYGLSDHLSSWNKLSVQLMKNVLEVVSLNGLLRIKKLEKLLDELWRDIDLEGSDLHCLVDDELEEEFVNSLEMRPCWVDFVLLLNACLREL